MLQSITQNAHKGKHQRHMAIQQESEIETVETILLKKLFTRHSTGQCGSDDTDSSTLEPRE